MEQIEEHEASRQAALEAVAQITEFAKNPDGSPVEKAPVEEKKQEDLELVECPRCGHHLKDREPVHPEQEEIKEYLRCLMTGKVFRKNYQLFDGELTATYSLLTGNESEVLSEALKQIKEEDFITHASKAVRIKLLFYLRRWADDTYEPPTTAKLEDLWNIWQERYGDKGEDLPVIMIKVMLEFIRLTELLPMSGLDENFYKGAGLS